MKSLLQKLSLNEVNPGASTGPDAWLADPAAEELISYNPTTGDPIAAVVPATDSVYDQVVGAAQTTFQTWRAMPAPKRGSVVR